VSEMASFYDVVVVWQDGTKTSGRAVGNNAAWLCKCGEVPTAIRTIRLQATGYMLPACRGFRSSAPVFSSHSCDVSPRVSIGQPEPCAIASRWSRVTSSLQISSSGVSHRFTRTNALSAVAAGVSGGRVPGVRYSARNSTG
jgi:hypothetical protein